MPESSVDYSKLLGLFISSIPSNAACIQVSRQSGGAAAATPDEYSNYSLKMVYGTNNHSCKLDEREEHFSEFRNWFLSETRELVSQGQSKLVHVDNLPVSNPFRRSGQVLGLDQRFSKPTFFHARIVLLMAEPTGQIRYFSICELPFLGSLLNDLANHMNQATFVGRPQCFIKSVKRTQYPDWLHKESKAPFSANRHFIENFGLADGLMTNDPTVDMSSIPTFRVHPEDEVHVNDEWRKAREGDGKVDVEYKIHHQRRGLCWVRLFGGYLNLQIEDNFQLTLDDQSALEDQVNNSLSQGSAIKIPYGMVMDISRDKVTIERWRESDRKLRKILDFSPVGLFEMNAEGKSVYLNPTAEKIFGYRGGSEEAFLRGWTEAIHWEDRELVQREWNKALQASLPMEVTCRIWNEISQTSNLTHVMVVPLVNPDTEKTLCFLGSLVNVTEGVLRKQAEEKARVKSEFVAILSHEIRTPLTGMIGMISSFDKTGLKDDQRDCFQIIKDCSNQLMAIVNDALDFSKIEAGELVLSMEKTYISNKVRSIISLFESKAREKDITISYYIDPAVPTIIISDPLRLRQILMNLVSNSIKFTDRGSISISVHRRELPNSTAIKQASSDDEAADASTTKEHFQLLIEVKDTGIGIPADKIDSLFKPFVQVDSSSHRRAGGTGLGLAICKHLVELFKGEIRITSEYGHGTCVSFTMDASYEEDDDESSGGGSSARTTILSESNNNINPSRGQRHSIHQEDSLELLLPVLRTSEYSASEDYPILVVEDNLVNQKVLQRFLIRLGYHNISFCNNGQEAIDLVLSRKREYEAASRASSISALNNNSNSNNNSNPNTSSINQSINQSNNTSNNNTSNPFKEFSLILMDLQMPVLDGYTASKVILESLPHSKIACITGDSYEGIREKCLALGIKGFLLKPFRFLELDALIKKMIK